MFHFILIKIIILLFCTKINLSYPSLNNNPSTESIEPPAQNLNAAEYDTDRNINYMADEKIIDLNNPDQNDMIQIKEMNVNLTAIRIQQEQLKNKYRNTHAIPHNLQQPLMLQNYDENDLNNNSRTDVFNNRRQFEELAREQIRQVLETNLIRNTGGANTQRRLPDDIHHYTAVYPQCNLPKSINTTTFFSPGNTWNLYFSPPASDNPLNAILRIFKTPTNDHVNEQTTNCSQSDDLIRITVSYYIKRREKRKRICSSLMLSKYYTGWIELDVKSAVKYWNKSTNSQAKRNYGIAIDVEDQDEQPLSAVSFFVGYTCEANTSPAIPWNIYEEQISQNFDSTVPKFPRIDFEFHQRGHHILKPNSSSPLPSDNPFSQHLVMSSYHLHPQEFSTVSELYGDNERGKNSDDTNNRRENKKYSTHRRHHTDRGVQQPFHLTTQSHRTLTYHYSK